MDEWNGRIAGSLDLVCLETPAAQAPVAAGKSGFPALVITLNGDCCFLVLAGVLVPQLAGRHRSAQPDPGLPGPTSSDGAADSHRAVQRLLGFDPFGLG